jgi:lipopolysaccharide/colanic/teichoic acid biosynthesis glycosyltransferase
MHTVDESSDPSVSLIKLSSPDAQVCRDSSAESASPTSTTALIQPLDSCQGIPKTHFGTGSAAAAAPQAPAWKRILDLTCILLSMPLWLPVMIFLTVWIRLASPGPIFFRQERVGYRGKRFLILKFRTMKLNVETQSHERHLEQLIQANCPMTKLDTAGDPRIIRGGRILRAMGLDELPQLLNVIRGEMSLVGPRPCTPYEYNRYQSRQRERVNALPGLTGYWQVNGKNKTTFTDMINMDIFYTENISLRLDVAIMCRTVPALVSQLIEVRTGTRVQKRTEEPIAEQSVAGQC